MRSLLLTALLSVVVVSGCAGKRTTAPQAIGLSGAAPSGGLASDQKIIVTPENALFGKVALVNPTGRFVVLNFPVGHLPVTEQHLNLYHRGLKVGEVRVTGPQQDDNIVADLVTGDASVGDDVRDK